MQKELNKIIKEISGNVVVIGLDNKLLEKLEQNDNILNCYSLGVVKEGKRKFGFGSKTIKIKKHRKKKYLTAENGLIYLAYNDRKHCMHIRTDLGFRSYVDKVNRSLLYKLYDYYMISNTMNSNDFFKKLNADEADRLNLIINSQNIFNDEEIDVLINTVLEYQYEKESSILKENIENKNNASIDDLVKLIENKKKLTKINKKKEN